MVQHETLVYGSIVCQAVSGLGVAAVREPAPSEGEGLDGGCGPHAKDLHLQRTFSAANGYPCRPQTRCLLYDLPLLVSGIRHVGKKGNDLKVHRAEMITDAERQLEHHNSTLEDLIVAFLESPTRMIATATGYTPRTVRRLKWGIPARNGAFG